MPYHRIQLQQKEKIRRPNSFKKVTNREKSQRKLSENPLHFALTNNVSSPDISPTMTNIQFLQRTIGNQALGRFIQTKLKIGQPGDKYEQEADRVAEAVMSMPEPQVRRQAEEEEEEEVQTKPISEQITPLVQRQTEEKEEEEIQTKPLAEQISPLVQRQIEEEEEEPIQTKLLSDQLTAYIQRHVDEEEEESVQAKFTTPDIPNIQRQEEPEEEEEPVQTKRMSGQSPEVTPEIASNINALRGGGGQPLPKSVRDFFEPRFGVDFSHVRVHIDAGAAESARVLNSKAFTIGQNVVFGNRQYTPKTTIGRQLLAHELTHVVQQSGSGGIHFDQRSGKRGVSPIAHTIQRQESGVDVDEDREEPSVIASAAAPAVAAGVSAAASTASSTPEITLETGNIGAGFLNNLVHQQVCVSRPAQKSKRCFSFAATGLQFPQFSSTWLGWDSWVVGAILKGEVYEPSPVSGATVVSRHTPTATQATTWLNYIRSTRLGLQDGYSVARHNCRKYSQWEFRDAPSHW